MLYKISLLQLADILILEQLNPSPTVNGVRHEQVKFPLSKPSLSHSALVSHGRDKQGSGTDMCS